MFASKHEKDNRAGGSFWLGVIVFLGLLAVDSQEGFAHVRRYAFTEDYRTIPQGGFEVEQWTTFKMPNHHRSNKNTFQYQTELEYGITDHWTVAHYERWETKNVVGPDGSTVYKGFKFETKYRMGEKGKYWLDPLLYLEWQTDPRDHQNPNTLEEKIVLSKEIGKFNATYNQIMESKLGSGGRTEHKFTVGMGYEWFGGFHAGVELKGDWWRPGSHRNRLALGPNLAYESQYFWVATSVVFGANHAADDVEARVIVGIPIG